jgi:HEPN domain-containing protein
MLIKPETRKLWEEALGHFRKAEELLNDNKPEVVSEEATKSVVYGCKAIVELSKELKMNDLRSIASNELNDWFDKSEKHYTPKEIIERARRTLKRLSDELPPDTLIPFE